MDPNCWQLNFQLQVYITMITYQLLALSTALLSKILNCYQIPTCDIFYALSYNKIKALRGVCTSSGTHQFY